MQRIAIVGAGVSGLSHAWFLKKQLPESEISIFYSGKVGGNIATETHDGCLLEPGPDSYLDRTGLFNQMVDDLDLREKLLFEEKRSAKRYILKDGYMVKAPTGPLGFFLTSLIFFPEKIRMFLAMGKKFSLWPTITFFDAARNVLGISAAEYLASPFARGVYGSEAEDLEFSSLYPELFKKISQAAKLKLALKDFSKENREYWQKELGDVKFQKGIYNFQGGLITWAQALEEKLKAAGVKFVADRISRIGQDETRKPVLSSKAKPYGSFDRVIFTVGSADLAYIFREHDKELSKRVVEMKYAPINVVYSAWNPKEFSVAGYGFLVPRKERAAILGTIFASNVFKGRSPADRFLTKTMVSGASDVFKDDDLSSLAEESLCRILRSRAKPLWSKVYRHAPGIPQYAPGHSEWRRDVLALAAKHEGVHFTGWNFSGVGMANQLEAAYRFSKTMTK